MGMERRSEPVGSAGCSEADGALRPEGIEWPFREDGAPTNRLELITKLNGVSHEHAHDALSDVFATIAVAKLVREKQPKLFDYLYKMREKNAVKKLVNLDNKQPFVYASGRYANEFNKTTVAVPLTAGRNGNVLVYDLRYNLEEVLEQETKLDSASHSTMFPIVKELCFNKCPAVAPMSVLDEGNGWKKIGLDKETVEHNLQILMKHPEFAEAKRAEYENRPEFPAAVEPEGALYDGFLNDHDRIKVAAVRNAEPRRLADFHPDFDDERLPELLLHYKGRNFPETLSESEAEAYEKYRQERLKRQEANFIKELECVKDDFIKDELMLYMQSLV